MNPSTFGLSADVPEAALDQEWRALVSQQAHTLAGMLQRLQTAVAGVPDRPDARRHATAQVRFERELGQLRALVTALSARPSELTERVQRLEQVLEVLHANLTTARQYLATVRSQEP